MVLLDQRSFRSSDVSLDVATSSEVPVFTEGDAAKLSTELRKAKELISEIKSGETITASLQEEIIDEVKQCHAEKIRVKKETSRENENSLMNDIKVAKADLSVFP